MAEVKTRGYTLESTKAFLVDQVGKERTEELLANCSEELQRTLAKTDPAGWYPVGLLSELNRLIVTELAGKDEEKVLKTLRDCGRFMGKEASNTFLRLMMKMLTPALFAKKLPAIFGRDFSSGRLEVETGEGTIKCAVYDVPGLDHVGVVASGFVSFALEAMGKAIDRVEYDKWSLADPNQDGVSFEFTWKT